MNSHVMSVLIVGCGNIGGRFDQDRSPGDSPLTHAGAFSRDARFELAACVEPDDNRRADFMQAWEVENGFRSISELTGTDEQFDVISICSPTVDHAQDLDAALCLKPKLIFCEKPVTPSLPESEAIVAKCRAAKIPLAVNYTRRWDKDISKLAMDIDTGRWGQLRSVIGTYNKGILNNGSHMLDLLGLFAGPLEVIKAGKPVEDYFADDPSVPAWLEGGHGLPIHLVCGHAADYALFEIQFIFSRGVLTMEDGGMHWRERRAVDSDTFKGYRNLDAGVRHAGKYPHAMLQAVDNIYRSINNGEALASTGESALAAQRLCGQIKRLAYGEFPA
jgi:predicted dehydrogenase